jgi:hypothetical protein
MKKLQKPRMKKVEGLIILLLPFLLIFYIICLGPMSTFCKFRNKMPSEWLQKANPIYILICFRHWIWLLHFVIVVPCITVQL